MSCVCVPRDSLRTIYSVVCCHSLPITRHAMYVCAYVYCSLYTTKTREEKSKKSQHNSAWHSNIGLMTLNSVFTAIYYRNHFIFDKIQWMTRERERHGKNKMRKKIEKCQHQSSISAVKHIRQPYLRIFHSCTHCVYKIIIIILCVCVNVYGRDPLYKLIIFMAMLRIILDDDDDDDAVWCLT